MVEEAGAGRWVVIFEPPGSQGLQSGTKALPGPNLGTESPFRVGLGDTSPLGAGLWN